MKAISIKQPWASLIVNGYKEYEFRSWNTKFRGKVYIHASKEVEKESLQRFEQLGLNYPTGQIIGSAVITNCIPITKEFETALIEENPLVYGARENRTGYAFQMESIQKFEHPVPMKGMLGFWNVAEELLDEENH